VAGDSYTTGNAAYHAFRYDGTPGIGGVMRDLGTLGGLNSLTSAVNSAGQVAGVSHITGNAAYHAFRYDGTPGSGGVMRDLGTLGGDTSDGHGINDAGQVVGMAYTTGNLGIHAFRYDGTPGSGGVMRDLGTLGAEQSEGWDINNSGQVTGYSYLPGYNGEHAFRYDGTPGSGGVMRDLGTLGGSYSGGVAINETGQVTGYSSRITGSGAPYRAFRYDGTPGSGGIMRDLGTLGGTYSQGRDINNAGQVAGWSEVPGDAEDPGRHAFLYLGTPGAGGQMIDLDTWLNANNPAEGAKWMLENASGISETGWIAGTGTYDPDGPGGIDGAGRAYLIDVSSLVPEPGGLALIAFVLPALLRRRTRRACL
jgi:probable HAF family extracellular repeat protein